MIQDGFDYGDGYEKATEPGPDLEFWTGEKWTHRHDQQESLSSCYEYRKPIKPKDEKMEETKIEVNISKPWLSTQAFITLDEAERVCEEAKRIKAEIAKREEIGPGDWFISGGKRIMKCLEINGNQIMTSPTTYAFKSDARKLHPTPEVRAWLDIVIGGEG